MEIATLIACVYQQMLRFDLILTPITPQRDQWIVIFAED